MSTNHRKFKKKKTELIINFIYWLQNFLVYQDKSGAGDVLSFIHLLLLNRNLLSIQEKAKHRNCVMWKKMWLILWRVLNGIVFAVVSQILRLFIARICLHLLETPMWKYSTNNRFEVVIFSKVLIQRRRKRGWTRPSILN